jgi:DNA-binding NarL/FixJ family response regulator
MADTDLRTAAARKRQLADVPGLLEGTMSISLVLADPYPVTLEGLVHRLIAEKDFRILACAQDGEEALQAVRQLKPDIVVLDLHLPGKDGLTLIREMKRDGLPTQAVVFTAAEREGRREIALEVVRLGVRGVVMKDMALQWLVRCIREVHAGRKWLEKGVAARTVENLLKREELRQEVSSILTPREIEVARMASKGLPNKSVAGRLAITEGTAKLHLHHVYQKLHLNGRMALMQYLQDSGLL